VKSTLAVVVLGLLALVVQGAIARAISPPWCPDFAWLVVVGIGLRWPGFLSGLLLSGLLGFAMDAVSGSLIGQHALLRLVSYLVAAVASRQLDLSGGIPIALLTFSLSVAYGFGIVATRSMFLGPEPIALEVVAVAIAHGFVNMLCAGPVVGFVERIVNRFADEELTRRGSLALGYSTYPGRGRS
jgi:rod shape-determining protein MreD